MLTSINVWTFPADMPIAEIASRCAQAGFEALELAWRQDGELTDRTSKADCQAIARQVTDRGLKIASLATGMYWQTNFASPDPTDRARARDLTLAALDRAAWLDAGAILCIPAVVGAWNAKRLQVPYEDAMARSCEALTTLAPEAEARGVVIAIENVWNKFLLSPLEMRDLINRVNSPWVGVYFDVGNVVAFGYPEDWIRTLGHRIARVHLKDFASDVGGIEGFCPLGEGDVDWPAVLAALNQVRYDGPLTYEGPGDPADIKARIDRILAGA